MLSLTQLSLAFLVTTERAEVAYLSTTYPLRPSSSFVLDSLHHPESLLKETNNYSSHHWKLIKFLVLYRIIKEVSR